MVTLIRTSVPFSISWYQFIVETIHDMSTLIEEYHDTILYLYHTQHVNLNRRVSRYQYIVETIHDMSTLIEEYHDTNI